ncbi:hypothetical protein [Olivibacter sitiensis]|uniref:hypothetical protein n=1 Tax=Olivibacter sitiensis TaxID=376470 RepID=UPI000413F4BD|nr:hypothetical protein [Olivibacter sitiensis]
MQTGAPLYNPFKAFRFDNNTCFLSGEKLSSEDEQIQVFPIWLMQQYHLEDQPFKLLDESISTYKSLKLPCSTSSAEKLHLLEKQVKEAFDGGYASLEKLPKMLLFQWIGKIMYGVIFNEIQLGLRQQMMTGEPMNFSQVLARKFTNLHYMLQSLIAPVVFDGTMPFSIEVFPVENEKETFSYRDEINTLVFSLRMKDFGLIACLQDNGTNSRYNSEKLEKIGHNKLHPIQFEEICGCFFYSAYLFNRLPEYTILPTPDSIYIEPMPLSGIDSRPIFDHFQAKTYGQVLENFWKPWGYTLFEIIKDPDNPKSFLFDQDGKFIPCEEVDLPLAGHQ